jgi:hypothetical protein
MMELRILAYSKWTSVVPVGKDALPRLVVTAEPFGVDSKVNQPVPAEGKIEG